MINCQNIVLMAGISLIGDLVGVIGAHIIMLVGKFHHVDFFFTDRTSVHVYQMPKYHLYISTRH